jgi:hypothetical protein
MLNRGHIIRHLSAGQDVEAEISQPLLRICLDRHTIGKRLKAEWCSLAYRKAECLGKRASPRLLAGSGDAHLEVGLRTFIGSKHRHGKAECSFIEIVVQQQL